MSVFLQKFKGVIVIALSVCTLSGCTPNALIEEYAELDELVVRDASSKEKAPTIGSDVAGKDNQADLKRLENSPEKEDTEPSDETTLQNPENSEYEDFSSAEVIEPDEVSAQNESEDSSSDEEDIDFEEGEQSPVVDPVPTPEDSPYEGIELPDDEW